MKFLSIRVVCKLFFGLLERLTNSWITILVRPKSSAKMNHIGDCNSEAFQNYEKIGIVMQGPLRIEENFTLETLRIYKKMFPQACLIISTWQTEDPNVLEALRAEGAHVVVNKAPENPGIRWFNFQIVSTVSGLRKAQSLDCVYCLKTRTDQRVYRHDMLDFLIAILNRFPLAAEIVGLQKKRLVATSLNTFKFRMYGISDMFLFGDIQDMMTYWCIPLDDRSPDELLGLPKNPSMRDVATMRLCEVYCCTEFLAKLGITPLWTLHHSLRIYVDHFCIIDKEQVDLFWGKYQKHIENRFLDYSARKGMEEFKFSDWLRLLEFEKVSALIPEKCLDESGSSALNNILSQQ